MMQNSLPDPRLDGQFYQGVRARRLVAFVIDAAAIAIVAFLVSLFFGVATLGLGFAMALPVLLTVSFLYRYLSLARYSATPGMALCGIELRRADGRKLGDVDAALHTAVFLVCFYSVGPQLISVGMMALSPTGRGVADLAAAATMINRPDPTS